MSLDDAEESELTQLALDNESGDDGDTCQGCGRELMATWDEVLVKGVYLPVCSDRCKDEAAAKEGGGS